MRGDPEINQALNAVLRQQLTAINQLFLHARMLQNWGLAGLGHHVYEASISMMKQSDALIKRILFLEGLPNLQDLDRLRIAEAPAETVACDLALHHDLRGRLVDAVALTESAKDYQTRELLEAILGEVEEQIDWCETQQHLMETTGLENYLQSQVDGED